MREVIRSRVKAKKMGGEYIYLLTNKYKTMKINASALFFSAGHSSSRWYRVNILVISKESNILSDSTLETPRSYNVDSKPIVNLWLTNLFNNST